MSVGFERGFATVAALGIIAMIGAAGAAAVAVTAAVVVHEHAAVAADAAALAGAVAAMDGSAGACNRAADLASRNGGRLVSCSVAGTYVEVGVREAAPGWLSWAGAAEVIARAGPADVAGQATKPDEP